MKEIAIAPIRTESLKGVFVARFEELILSGQLSIGQKLPSERSLALKLGVSRPVVHEGLVDLAAKGLVTMKPHIGSIVNDYRKEGSLVLLSSLTNYHEGDLEPELLESLLEMRRFFEIETARLATKNRTEGNLNELKEHIKKERSCDHNNKEKVVELDFAFHHLIAIATGNFVYPLLINSFKQVYTNLTGKFFLDKDVIPFVFDLHRSLVSAVEDSDEHKTATIMECLLDHGEEHLRKYICNYSGSKFRGSGLK